MIVLYGVPQSGPFPNPVCSPIWSVPQSGPQGPAERPCFCSHPTPCQTFHSAGAKTQTACGSLRMGNTGFIHTHTHTSSCVGLWPVWQAARCTRGVEEQATAGMRATHPAVSPSQTSHRVPAPPNPHPRGGPLIPARLVSLIHKRAAPCHPEAEYICRLSAFSFLSLSQD